MDKITSEVTEDCDSMDLPRMGDRCPRGLPSPCPASWGSEAPGGLRGRELAMPVAPPGPSSSTTVLPMPHPLPPCDRQAAPLQEGTYLASQPAPSSTSAIPCSGRSRLSGLGWPGVTGLAFATPPFPWRRLPGIAAVSPHLVCVCPHFLGANIKGQPSRPNTHLGSPRGCVYVGNSCTK